MGRVQQHRHRRAPCDGPHKISSCFPLFQLLPKSCCCPSCPLPGRSCGRGKQRGKLDAVAAWGGSSLFWAVFSVRLEMRALRGSSCLLQGRREMWTGLNGVQFSRCLGSPMDLSPWTPLIHRGASGPTWSVRHLQEGELHTFGVCPEEPQPLLDLSPQLSCPLCSAPFWLLQPFFPITFSHL